MQAGYSNTNNSGGGGGGSIGIGPPGPMPGSNYGSATPGSSKPVNGGRFDFDDGGTYCGGWEDGKAHGHGVCTGPKGQGEYSGSWHFGFEVSGKYTWPSGSSFEGQWQNGKRHGLGTEFRGRWTYRGEWTQGFKGRYGVRQATASNAKYEGTWANGLQDGYGSEAYADGGTYQGQWLRGLRHGYGVRTSAPFGMASHFRPKAPTGSMASLKSESATEPTSERDRRMDDVRGGFVLKARSDEPPPRRRSLVEKSSNFKDSILKGLKLRKQRSTGDLDKKGNASTSIRSTASNSSWMSNDSAQSGVTSGSHHTDSNASFVVEDEHMDTNVTETYMGEWKNDKRSGFGISERSDGLKYEGEWYNNKKYGYGVTTLKDGTKEEGKYKNNVLITSQKKKHLFLMRSAKFRERIDAAVNAAQRASKIALQKADIAISRTATARGKAEQADIAAAHAREDSEIARVIAKQFAPDFHQPGTEIVIPHAHHLSSQQQQQLHQTIGDLSNKLGQATNRLPQNRDPYASSSGGGPAEYRRTSLQQQQHLQPGSREMSIERTNKYHDEYQNQQHNQPSYSNYPETGHYENRIDAQQQHAQQPYMNRTNPPPGGGGHFGGPSSVSHQNLVDMNYGEPMTMTKGGSSHMMNSIGRTNPGIRDYTHTPHSQQQSQFHEGSGAGTNLPYTDNPGSRERGRDTMRRVHPQLQQQHPRSVSRPNNPTASAAHNYQQAMSDHFDHYKRAPSRDSSMDRYSRTRSRTRGQTPEIGANPQSRASSRQRTPFESQQSTQGQPQPLTHASSQNPMRSSNMNLVDYPELLRRGETPGRTSGKDSPIGPMGGGGTEAGSVFSSGPIDEMIIRQRGLGQEIPPSIYTPKRTESLFLKSSIPNTTPSLLPMGSKISGGVGIGGISNPVSPGGSSSGGGGSVTLKRKKSLPDSASLPKVTPGMSREEVAALGSARRQELHRIQDEAERYRANPFLYLLNPNVMNWFSRQKLMVLVLFINLSLAIMFLQLLT